MNNEYPHTPPENYPSPLAGQIEDERNFLQRKSQEIDLVFYRGDITAAEQHELHRLIRQQAEFINSYLEP